MTQPDYQAEAQRLARENAHLQREIQVLREQLRAALLHGASVPMGIRCK
jgi:hypothetical protein